METHAEEASKALRTAEKKLQRILEEQECDYTQLESFIEKFRIHNGNESLKTYFLTDEPAEAIEFKLWDAHVKVNGKFKGLLKSFREGHSRKKHVERRKAEKLYLDFIKASQRFYRAYIQRLASNFTGVPSILEAARVLNQDILSGQQTKHANPELKAMLDRSCKQTIIRLGDLSRWRETELSRKERNWGPATGYYQFALILDPTDGVCYNQLAVISQANDNHLNTVYYFHRAAAVEHPSPTAVDNIKLKFEKLLKTGSEDTLGTLDMSDDIVSVLEKRFLAFHAECYVRPFDFVSFTHKATDIVRLFAIGFQETKDQAFDALLAKICLINITAEYLAKQGTLGGILHKQLSHDKLPQETERHRQTFVLLQRFNMMTFQALLKILSRETESLSDNTTNNISRGLSHISPVARRVIPNLRQYSSWLLSNVSSLVNLKYKSSKKAMEQVWQVYVQALNLLLTNVDVFSPSQVNYLLAEDEDTSAFTPFTQKVKEWRFQSAGFVKASFNPRVHVKTSDSEFHLRATDIVIDALRLVKHKDDLELDDSPVSLNGQSFEYHRLAEPEAPQEPPSPPRKLWRGRAHAHAASLNGTPSATTPEPGQIQPNIQADQSHADALVAHHDQSAMEHMVSDLVDSQPKQPKSSRETLLEPSSVSSNTPNVVTSMPRPISSQLTAMDLVRQMQRASTGSQHSHPSPQSGFSTMNTSIPNIYQTAFTPTAGESANFGSRPGTAPQCSSSGPVDELTPGSNFRDEVMLHQNDVESRISPHSSHHTTSNWGTFGRTPTGLDSVSRAFQESDHTSSLYSSSSVRLNSQGLPSPRQVPQTALFGVIGQQRSISRNSPTNDRSG